MAEKHEDKSVHAQFIGYSDYSMQDMKLVVLTVPDDGVCNLKVQSLPVWETVYDLQLNAPSMLAKCNTFQVHLTG